jgi:hypothetical protein
MSSFKFLLRAEDRVYGESGNAQFNIQRNFSQSEYYSISLSKFVCLNSVYPVNAANNTVVFSVNGNLAVTFTATIPPGAYTGTSFATALTTALNVPVSGVTFTATYNPDTFKITITCNGVNTVLIRAPSFGTTFNTISGFKTTLVGFQNAVTGDSQVNLSGTSALKIRVSFPTGSVESSGESNLMTYIPVNVSPFSYIFYDDNIPSIPVVITCRSNDLNNIRIMLYDDNDTQWNPSDDFPWEIVFNVSTSL